jgi:hypothetical protein
MQNSSQQTFQTSVCPLQCSGPKLESPVLFEATADISQSALITIPLNAVTEVCTEQDISAAMYRPMGYDYHKERTLRKFEETML